LNCIPYLRSALGKGKGKLFLQKRALHAKYQACGSFAANR
jgi:hypothetical protein